MRFRTVFSVAALLAISFAVVVWATPAAAAFDPTSGSDAQAVSGRISSIGDAAFTLDVTKKDGVQANTLQFMVDEDTKVEGQLTVGAQARVEYRDNGGKYIATRIAVMPAPRPEP
jgi:hypothetical protein